MILELLGIGALVSLVSTSGGIGFVLGRRKKADEPISASTISAELKEAAQEVEDFLNPPPPKESVPWQYNFLWGTTTCTKCNHKNKWRGKNYRLCSCRDYPRPHFHITCVACGYKTIMRSADEDVK